jgi:3-amino-5-hydroxybenzoate synthase
MDEQTKRRHDNGRLLDRLLGNIEGITPQVMDDRCTRNGHYAYIFHVDAAAFSGMTTERFIQAMVAEGIPHQASYPPVHALDLFQNGEYKSRLCPEMAKEDHAFLKAEFPVTHRAAWETVWIPQYALLGDEEDMREIATAVGKIKEHARELADM